MSRAYRIQWVSVGANVSSSDQAGIDLTLLGILPEGEMVDLLRAELERDGWARDERGRLATKHGEVEVALDEDGRGVTLRVETARDVQARGVDAGDADRALDAASQQADAAMKEDIARTITAAEPDVRAGLDAAVQRAYVAALTKKAGQMGRVESVHETRDADGAYEVTIKVRT